MKLNLPAFFIRFCRNIVQQHEIPQQNIPEDSADSFIVPQKNAQNVKIEELKDQNRRLLIEEAEFHNEREYYKDIFNNQPAGLYRLRVFHNNNWDAENLKNNENNPYVLDFASDRYYEILGISKSEIEKNPSVFTKYLSDEDLKSFTKANTLANKKLQPFRWEGRLVIRNNVKWTRFVSKPPKLQKGGVI